jgi:hypothetical protein
MEQLLQQILDEKSQLEDHKKHGELHTYIDENADDLMHLFNRCIQLMSKGEKQDAA